ncbi:SAM hydrolase/SAM-dependent halogenase family protein [Hydrogenivirga sp.]
MVVALLTDFGTRDGFVGVVKGVILSINPGVSVVDISHEVEPFGILEGALLLRAHYRYFPPGTVFVAVVDPGVGSERKPIALRAGEYFFVGPDNGIFDLVVREFKRPPSAVVLEDEKYQLPRVNNTFHGRDIFAPAAAYISKGVPLKEFGREIDYKPKLNFPEVRKEGKKFAGKIIHFDRFGNAITNVPCGNYSHGEFRGEKLRVVPFFQAGERGKLNLICGSFGFMELFIPMASAREELNLKLGEEVSLWLS